MVGFNEARALSTGKTHRAEDRPWSAEGFNEARALSTGKIDLALCQIDVVTALQ